MEIKEDKVESFYDKSYQEQGLDAQRRWPNEEFCRFMGRNYFKYSYADRKQIKILEAGCGTGANLRLLAMEGFDTYGVDLAEEAIKMVPLLVEDKNIHVKCGNMTRLEYKDEFFDAVVDIFSSFCLNEKEYARHVDEVFRVLKSGGKYFSYTPAKGSDAFVNYMPSNKIDESTLDGIHRKDAPFFGNFYPFRFIDVLDIERVFDPTRFDITYMEKTGRTYGRMREYFEFMVFEATKK